MARSPQGAGAQKKPTRKRAAKPLELPPSPRALGIDDLMGEFGGAAASAPTASIDLDDILGELAGPAHAPTAPVAAEPAPDLDSLLDDLIVPAPQTSPVADPLDEIMGEIAPDPVQAAPPVDDLDDLVGELSAPAGASPGGAAPAGSASAATDEGVEPPKQAGGRKLPSISVPPRIRLLVALGGVLMASHALAFWLGTLALTAARPEGPVVGASEHAVAEEETAVAGLARYAGKEVDARIDGKTMFEDDEFRTAVDELVGGPEASAALEALLPNVRATQPILRKGTALTARGCNPESCGLENLTVEYDTATRRAKICVTQPSGDPPVAISSLYDGEGAREVPNCEGYPHPPRPKQRAQPVEEMEPADPADITFSAGADKGSISERIHAELAKLREEKKRKRHHE